MQISLRKDFDTWNVTKKTVDEKVINEDFFFHEREVWWCSLGLNIGVESDGKNDNFERPVLIIKKFNTFMIWIIPLTTQKHDTNHFSKIHHELSESWACLTQIRTISTKRLLRKIGMTNKNDFEIILRSIANYIKIEPRVNAGFSEAEATNEPIISLDGSNSQANMVDISNKGIKRTSRS